MSNPFRSMHIEYHILQSFPVTCLNRDDVGAPKTAVIGGVTRARVSSQCWKRQVRLQLHELGVKLAVRSKKVGETIAKQCIALGASEEQAKAWGEACAKEIANDTLFFFPEKEAIAFAEFGKTKSFNPAEAKIKEISKLAGKIKQSYLDGLDIALFGRMVASAAEMNVEAASSFSHAISIHKVTNEVEFFTALDDLQDEPGSAHMGTLEFNSATYYRYISLDLGQLYTNLGESAEDVAKAVEQFTKAIYLAIPEARQNTQSGSCFWDYAKILVRKGQRLQVPFDAPVKPQNGYLEPGIKALTEYLNAKEKQAGSLFQKIKEISFGHGEDTGIDQVVEQLGKAIQEVKA